MLVFRKRLVFWLFKAYIRKLGKRILFFFLIGLILSFLLKSVLGFVVTKLPSGHQEGIGMVGAYTVDDLPNEILEKISSGLTNIGTDGKASPSLARKWKIQDNGKTYIFYLKSDIVFSDGKKFTSKLINYKFSNTQTIIPDDYTIVYRLKDSYTPFLITVSRPIFKDNLIGVGSYKIKDLKLNGNYVQSITLVSVKDKYQMLRYNFYPSQESLKMAFVLGEITKGFGLSDLKFENSSLDSFPNIKIEKKENQRLLTTIFFNTADPVLSDKKVRNGLSYSLPNEFSFGRKAFSLLSPFSWAYSEQYVKIQDLEHAKDLISQSSTATGSAKLALNMKVLSKYKVVGETIAKEWEKAGVKTKIEVTDSIPTSFQVFLGDFYLPSDPDQYTLWHSNQDNNITNYKNLRIDKLLEDGRKTVDLNVRKKIYLDFQKYILDDNPATFLYYPYEYEITRKLE